MFELFNYERLTFSIHFSNNLFLGACSLVRNWKSEKFFYEAFSPVFSNHAGTIDLLPVVGLWWKRDPQIIPSYSS